MRPEKIDLSNCDREPIHVPGSIQPHGVLLAMDRELTIRQVSANAGDHLDLAGDELLGRRLDAGLIGEEAFTVLAEELGGGPVGELDMRALANLNPLPVRHGSRRFDGVAHRSGETLVLELEAVAEDARPLHSWAVAAQRSLERFQATDLLPDLLQAAVEEVHRLTGFHRVMAYRFQPDDSGKVVAEELSRDEEPYLGLRYPASDIPAQARRLYTINLLRLIANSAYDPSPLVPAFDPATGEPLDLTHSVLRSVSPIHREYLANMGVAASMSISIVVEGELWGLIACHHYEPLHVPYPVRMGCRLIGRTLGLLAERMEKDETVAARARMDHIRLEIQERARQADDMVRALTGEEPGLRQLIPTGGAAVTLDNRIVTEGRAPDPPAIAGLVAWLDRHADADEPRYVTQRAGREIPVLEPWTEVASGLLAVPYHRERGGWLLWFQPEEVHTVRWAGDPRKAAQITGPNGPRLTPRGSFAEWRETVRNTSEPWSGPAVRQAAVLSRSLAEIALRKEVEAERTRDLFLGMLGHDLRTPLQAISVAAQLIGQFEDGRGSDAISERISRSSRRMRRLIDHLLDFNRIRSGTGLGLEPETADLDELVRGIVAENELGYPGIPIEVLSPGPCEVVCDPDRVEQVLANLISNARHHGVANVPIIVELARVGDDALVAVHNVGEPIPEEVMERLFEPYSPTRGDDRQRRSGGLGLGLYISHEIVRAHGGSIEVKSTREAGTRFTVRLPVDGGGAGAVAG